jgi:hypothetical protein
MKILIHPSGHVDTLMATTEYNPGGLTDAIRLALHPSPNG